MGVSLSFSLYVVKLNIIITSSCFLSDGELWPYQELPGPGGDVHDSDDHPVSYRGEESHHRTVQLRPWDDAWSQVIWCYSSLILHGERMHGLISQVTSVLIIDVSDPVLLCVLQWSGVPQIGPDDRGLWEPSQKDDGGVCSPWKGRNVFMCSVMHQHFDFCLPPSLL